MITGGKMRPLDIRRDLDSLADLIEATFAGELANRGDDIREEIQTAKRLVPLLTVLGRLSEDFRHLFDGFVWEDQGRIVSSVTVQRMGNDKARWLIGTVATLPDYRRQGLARKLVTQAMEHARAHGAEVCVLDVRANNPAAYNLYRSLDFVHYDSTTDLKLETLPQVQAKPIDDYTLRRMELGEWQACYELAVRETPPEVAAFLPVSKAEYRISTLRRLLIPLLMRLQRLDPHRWAAEKNNLLVGTMILIARRSTSNPHEIRLTIDSAHRAALAEPLLTLALETLQPYPRQNILLTVRTAYEDLLALLQRYGFVEIDTTHRLGAKLRPAHAQNPDLTNGEN
jgi:ribosomal protein S18 acetylase RimI-like enzyme